MIRRASVLAALLAVSLTACLDANKQSTSPVGIITMNARVKGAGFTTSPVANFFSASSITLASAAGASDSCIVAAYTAPGAQTADGIGAGSVLLYTVSGRTDTLRKATTSDLTYRSSLASGLAFTPGDSVVFTVPGDLTGFGAGSFRARTAEAFTASTIAIPPAGQALPVTWSPVGDAASAMIISLRYNEPTASGTGLNAQIFCDFIDDGAATIPAALAAKWAASTVRDTYMQRLRTLIWQSTSGSQYANVVSTFEMPTPVSP